MDRDESWYDHEAGPLVRPFALTRGRAGTNHHQLDLITLVRTTTSAADSAALNHEYARIVSMCRVRPLSVAEISAALGSMVSVAKVLIGDLLDDGHLALQSTRPAGNTPDLKLLLAVLNGVRRI